jgi:RNA polymerase sigma-70 factor (ECF subfamily)
VLFPLVDSCLPDAMADTRPAPEHAADDASPGAFVTLLLKHQRAIHAYIATLVPVPADLDDVYQQTCLTLWEKHGDYDPARPFLPWACGFARNKAFEHARRRRRDGICLSVDVLAQIAEAREQNEATAAARRAALDGCIMKLPAPQRDLLIRRYGSGTSVKELAAKMAVSGPAVVMRLKRIRHALLRCVETALAAKGGQ